MHKAGKLRTDFVELSSKEEIACGNDVDIEVGVLIITTNRFWYTY